MNYEPATHIAAGPTPGALALEQYARDNGFGSAGVFNPRAVRGSTTLSLHAEGRAVDITPAGRTDALTELVHALVTNHEQLGVQCVIWQRRIWSVAHDGWRDYTGVDPHESHTHVELTRSAAANLTLATIQDVLNMPSPQEIADAILDAPVGTHSYNEGQDVTVTVRTLLAYIHMELQQIRLKP